MSLTKCWTPRNRRFSDVHCLAEDRLPEQPASTAAAASGPPGVWRGPCRARDPSAVPPDQCAQPRAAQRWQLRPGLLPGQLSCLGAAHCPWQCPVSGQGCAGNKTGTEWRLDDKIRLCMQHHHHQHKVILAVSKDRHFAMLLQDWGLIQRSQDFAGAAECSASRLLLLSEPSARLCCMRAH